MKNKTYIKQSAFQKVTNTPSKKIKGALDFNKEVLDTLVDKDLVITNDCCKYFPLFPIIEFNEDDPTYSNVPVGAFFIETSGGSYYPAFKVSEDTILYNGEYLTP